MAAGVKPTRTVNGPRRAINETSVLYNRLLLSVLESIVLIDMSLDLFVARGFESYLCLL